MYKKLLIGCAVLISAVLILCGVMLYVSEREAEGFRSALKNRASGSAVRVTAAEIEKLPEPVRRYFRYALGDSEEFSGGLVSWQEKGDFYLPGPGHFSMSAGQVSRTDAPDYVWRGFMKKLGGLITLESRDAFSTDSHDMRAKLFGMKTIMSSRYSSEEELNSLHSYLMLRYYGTALNFPWTLLTSSNISWTHIDADRALMTAEYGDYKSEYVVTFSGDGSISMMEGTEYQLHGNDEYLKETAYKSGYVEWNGVMVPTEMRYVWRDREGAETTYQFRIYNIQILD